MGEMRFSEEFDGRKPTEQITYLKKLASSQNEALDLMQKERNDLANRVIALESQLVNAQNNVDINKQIMIKNLTDTNAEREARIREIQQLNNVIKEKNKIIEELSAQLKQD